MYWTSHTGAGEYIAHIHTELARLGLYEDWQYGTQQLSVVQELIKWLDDQPSQELAGLHQWQHLDLRGLLDRWKDGSRSPKPRIDLTIEITQRENLSVWWYPAGYRDAIPVWGDRENAEYSGDLRRMKFREPPDFRHYVKGHLYANYRPDHELMFIRDVGRIRPDIRPRSANGLGNVEVLDELVICAVRAALDHFVRGLRRIYDVTLLDELVFVLEKRSRETYGSMYTMDYVTAWRIEDRYDPMAARRGAEQSGSAEVVQLRPKKDGDAPE